MAHDPKAVANYFLDCADAEGIDLTPMKLIKLVYIAHGWSLGVRGRPLIREQVEAWKYGPVINSLYHHFKRFGNSPISVRAEVPQRDINGNPLWDKPMVAADLNRSPVATEEPKLLAGDKKLLDRVWSQYKDKSATDLSAMTHAAGTPWDTTWYQRGGSEYAHTDINVDLIKTYYRELADSE